MNDQSATKADIDRLGAELRTELASKADLGAVKADLEEVKADIGTVKSDVAQLRTDLERVRAEMATKTDLQRLERNLFTEIGRAINASVERFAEMTGVLDDRAKGTAEEVKVLRRDLDEHRSDLRIHVQPSPAPAKRAARRPTR